MATAANEEEEAHWPSACCSDAQPPELGRNPASLACIIRRLRVVCARLYARACRAFDRANLIKLQTAVRRLRASARVANSKLVLLVYFARLMQARSDMLTLQAQQRVENLIGPTGAVVRAHTVRMR